MEQDFTPEEISEVCRVHVSTVRRWIAHGQLQAIRLPGGTYRIPAAEVDKLREPVRAVGA